MAVSRMLIAPMEANIASFVFLPSLIVNPRSNLCIYFFQFAVSHPQKI
jgi:hypothetical protein